LARREPPRRSNAVRAAIVMLSGLAIFAPMRATAQSPTADEIHWTITGPNSVTFDWRGTANIIRYGTTPDYGQDVAAVTPSPVPFSSPGPFWEARITGLQENTVYHYSIGGGANHTFKTPPRRGSSGFTVFAQGDIGETAAYSEMATVQSMIAAERPDFVLALGDLTYGNRHGQAAVDQHFNDVMVWSQDAAYMPAWGNHEWDYPAGDDLRNYKGRFDLPNPQTSPGAPAVSCCGEDWSWFDYGNARFIAYPDYWTTATWPDWFNKASVLMDQAQADPAIAYIVTYGHRPGYSTGNYVSDRRLRPFVDSLGVRHSKFVLNLTGHDHNYQRSKPQFGVTHITSGIAGAGLYALAEPATWTAFQIVHHGALRLRFTQEGITGVAICGPPGGSVSCVQGSAMDQFFIANPNPDQPPVVTAPARVRTVPGQTVTIAVTAADFDGDAIEALIAEAGGVPATFVADPSNVSGTLTWTPGIADTGSYRVTFTASNALSGSTTTTIDVVGSDRPPIVMAPSLVVATPGARLDVMVHVFDPDGEPITSLRADLEMLPPGSGATFTTIPGDSAGTFSWTPAAADVRAEPHTIVFIASNALGAAVTTAIRVELKPTTLEKRIVGGSDDAEESATGSVSLTGTDLELVTDSNVQVVGLRFTGLAIPTWAQITNAYLQFKSDESHSGATTLSICGQVADNAPVFTSVSRNVSSRVGTAASVSWTPPPWTTPIGQAGAAQRTPDLAPVIQEIVARPGWRSGNALALIVTGTGRRTAETYEGDAPGAPLLHVEFVPGTPINQPPVVDAGLDRTITLPAEAILDGTVTDDGLPTSNLTIDWSVVSGPGSGIVAFTGGTGSVDTRASFTEAGRYVLRLTVSDGALTASDTVAITAILAGSVSVVVEKRVTTGADDAEESATGSVALTSSDLELVTDANAQVVGLRFTGIAIPRGAHVRSAYVRFKVDESFSGVTELTIRGQAADSATVFTTARWNLSSRVRTTAAVPWTPPPWTTIGQAGVAQQTPDLAPVIHEIVGRDGWRSGSALALFITGTGRRTAEAFEGDKAGAPLLYVELAPSIPALAAASGQASGEGSADSTSSGVGGSAELHDPPIRGALGVRVIPNPMHSEGWLQLVTAHAGPARVELFDAAGRRVGMLLDTDDLPAGSHAFPVRIHDGAADRLAPGVYFYRARVRGAVGNGRFLVLE